MDTHHQTCTDIMSDYCDGKIYKAHPLFSTDPVALQLILYDELELCNPFGSRCKKHKIDTCILVYLHMSACLLMMHIIHAGAFYYLLGNVSPHFRSKIHHIQLLLLAKYALVAEFGIDQILEPIVEDIKKLESVYTCMQ